MSQTPPENQPTATPPAAPARPDGISEEEWNALGDPGKQAIVRERNARADLERQLNAARARPTPPPGVPTATAPPATPATPPTAQPPATPTSGQPDLAALIGQAVTAAVAPLQQRLDGYETQSAAQRVHDAITTAAGDRFHDPADAFKNLDLAGVVDAGGQPDPAKIGAAIDKLLADKPYLGKPVDGRRFAPAPVAGAVGPGATPGGAIPPIADQVKNVLHQMQATTGMKLSS